MQPLKPAPDITELLNTIHDLRTVLQMAEKYLDHPGLSSIQFAATSADVAERCRKIIEKATDVINRAEGTE